MKNPHMIQEPTEPQPTPIDFVEGFPDIQRKKHSNKKFYVIIILLHVALVAVSATLVYFINQNCYLKDLVADNSSKITELTDNVSKLKKETKQLQDELAQKNKDILEKDIELSDWRTAARESINSRTAARESVNRSSSTGSTYNIITAPDEAETVCLSPGCNSTPALNSYYCHRHKCLSPSCPNPKANTFCNYCTDHKCAYPDCNSARKNRSYYCFRHSK